MGFVPGIHDLFEDFEAFHRSLGILLTVPEISRGHFFIDVRNLAFAGLQVKDTPLSLGVFP